MGTLDFINLLKVNILKNKIFLGAVSVLFLFISYISTLLPKGVKVVLLDPFNFYVFLASILIFSLIRELIDKFIKYRKSGFSYSFTSKSWVEDWVFNGKTTILMQPLRLTVNSSRAGCLLNNYLWKDLKMNFQAQFLDTERVRYYKPHIGIIFRAMDLENYLMLELLKEDDLIWIKPHIRYQGMWETMSEVKIGKISNEVKWLKVQLVVKGRETTISIDSVGEYNWFLPTHVDINHIEDGIRKIQGGNSEEKSKEDFGTKISLLPKIEFAMSSGMVGFRAHLDQGAEIKELKVEPVN